MSNKEENTKKETVAEDQVQQENQKDIPEVNTEEVKDEAEELKEALASEKDKFIRLFAEFDNFRKRTARESIEIRKTASSEVLTALLPILDDFDRAINELKKSEEDSLYKGVELIHNKLKNTLISKALRKWK